MDACVRPTRKDYILPREQGHKAYLFFSIYYRTATGAVFSEAD
jgi:hypothetical protein